MKFLSRIHLQRITFAILIPVAAWVIQAAFWPILSPYVWFLFYPAVFFSAWIGGLPGGTAASILSALIVWWYFIPPTNSFEVTSPGAYFSIVIFLVMGILFGYTQERLKQARARASAALSAARLANDQLLQANTQITQLYEKNRELDHLKSQFFANVSHELRTPLTLILGPVSQLLAEANLKIEEKHSLEVIERNARLLYRHVSDLLDVARLETKKMELHYTRTDCSQLARFVVSHFEVLAADKHIQYTVELPESLPAEVDAEKCQRILFNLLSNAFKFTPDGGAIRLNLAQAGEQVVFQVQDSGPGIPLEMHEAIFERFRQVESDVDRRYGGTGLGLTIVKEFTAMQGGTVQVGDAPGGGSLFTVRLPRSVPAGIKIQATDGLVDEEISRQLVEELRPAAGMELSTYLPPTAPVVLVVEDNPDMNAFIAAALSSRFRVVSAFDGNEGLRMALEERPDLIIADVMMPALSGDQMVSFMRQDAGLSDVPIVMLTAKVDDELRVRYLMEMVQDFVYKPFSVDELLARVGRLIAERAQKKQALLQSEERLIQELQESEARLMNAQAAAHVGNWEYNLSDQRLWASAEAFRIYGLDRTSPFMQLEEAQRLATAEDRPRLDKALSGLLEKRLPYNLEFRMRRANDGAERVIHTQAFLECDAQDKPLKVIGVLQDITERKQAEEALRQSEERWQFALEGPGDGVWDWDLTNNKIYFSQNWKAMLGYAPEEIGDTLDEWETRLHPDDRESTIAALNQYFEGKTPAYTSEHRLKCKDGSYKWILDRGKTVSHSPEGKALRMIGSHTDITERKQAEAQLREQLVELRRWHAVMLGRETRVIELKNEVNQLLVASGQPERYANLAGTPHD